MSDDLKWVSVYDVLILLDNSVEEPKQRVTAYNVSQNVSGRGADFPTAMEDMLLGFKDSLEFQLENNQPIEVGELDEELVEIYNDTSRKMTEDGEIVLYRVKLHADVRFIRTETEPTTSEFPSAFQPTCDFSFEMAG